MRREREERERERRGKGNELPVGSKYISADNILPKADGQSFELLLSLWLHK